MTKRKTPHPDTVRLDWLYRWIIELGSKNDMIELADWAWEATGDRTTLRKEIDRRLKAEKRRGR